MNKARETEERRGVERRRAGLVLSIRFLLDNGYVAAARAAEEEAGISLSKVDVADNIDMASILQDYEEYVQLKFGRPVKLTRKVSGSGGGRGEGHLPNIAANAASKMERRAGGGSRGKAGGGHGSGSSSSSSSSSSSRTRTPRDDSDAGGPERGMGNYAGIPGGGGGVPAGGSAPPGMGVGAAPGAGMGRPPKKNANDDRPVTPPPGMGIGGGFDVQVKRIERKPEGADGSAPHDPDTFYEDRLLKPLHPLFGGDSGSRELANLISRDIISANPGVTWDDIAELHECKRLLKEAVVMPLKYPQLFTGLLSGWNGVLLYGPPGTGKTMLAKAVATQCRTTFFNISASSMVSKWRGDSEKLVRVLFDLAEHHAPSTIFIDEIDSIMGQRESGEHEASRRMKTELLIQMDGLAKRKNSQVFVLAASNLPWELDLAMLRRLDKRILVPLPEPAGRLKIMRNSLEERASPDLDFTNFVGATEGYSGSDLMLVCKEAAMRPLRRLMSTLEDGPVREH
jgi:katanin p60 ATPase-containing subunit A1